MFRAFGFIAPRNFELFVQSFDFERSRYERVVRTKFDIYVFI